MTYSAFKVSILMTFWVGINDMLHCYFALDRDMRKLPNVASLLSRYSADVSNKEASFFSTENIKQSLFSCFYHHRYFLYYYKSKPTVSKLQEPQNQRAEVLFFPPFQHLQSQTYPMFKKKEKKENLKAHLYCIYIAYMSNRNQVKSSLTVLNLWPWRLC